MTTAARSTIDDVAALAEVSIKTVSRVVNQEPNVRESTRAKVLSAIKELKYRPNRAARNLASLRSHLIALIYDDPSAYELSSSGYVISMQAGALRACHAAQHELVIHPCYYQKGGIPRELQKLIEQARPDGIVLAAPLSNMKNLVDAICATGTPLVCLSPGTRSPGRCAVVTDDRSICAQMTEYLAGLGHSSIAFIKGNPKHKAVANRYKGYLDGLKKVGLKLDTSLVSDGDNSIGSGERCAAELLDLPHPPTAIFAANDDMAAGVLRVAHQRGLRVPDDLSVAGFDDSSLAQQIYPSLTSIRQPLDAMTEQAVKRLIAGEADGSAQPDMIASTLITRESTGPAPA